MGLENVNLMRITAKAMAIVKSKSISKKEPTARVVHMWLTKNVKWGARRTPSERTVNEHM